ncbi:TyrS-associated PheT N-terminal domain-related protein TapR [Mycoplasma marinum]|uniref:tRNA-binding domain-containing protein n=1 Tax=Mycoplasma marinum TaxID=1937190 RepID=A0A4R0XU79_9MOLU|nr:DUF4479 domain-containing protein [Mycoplasma marinum]TCG11229.1 hypothetical protein C4B24_02615 [Mycoplasma marinum]
MALLYWNKKSLQDQAIIWFKDSNKEKISIEKNDKYSLIKEKDEVVGINIQNASSFLTLKVGAQSLTHEIITSIKNELGVDLSNLNTTSMFVVGEILERKPHPKSDKLFLLKVKTDSELTIVTNTLNSIEGKKIVVAKLGAILPSGTIIKPAKVMGINSEGMLCGGETLGIEKTNGAFIVEKQNAGEEFNI